MREIWVIGHCLKMDSKDRFNKYVFHFSGIFKGKKIINIEAYAHKKEKMSVPIVKKGNDYLLKVRPIKIRESQSLVCQVSYIKELCFE